jgi:hypothetical protein
LPDKQQESTTNLLLPDGVKEETSSGQAEAAGVERLPDGPELGIPITNESQVHKAKKE